MHTHQGTRPITTQRLHLRRFTLADAEAMYANWASDPEVTKFLTWPTHPNAEVTRAILATWVPQYDSADYYQWAITIPEEGDTPIGSIAVVDMNEDVSRAHIGYCIGQKWWRRGIMSEAMQGVIGYLFDEVGMQRIDARFDPRNPGSGGVMRKCGMTFEGTLRRSDRNNQGICDACWYSILAQEYRK